MKESARVRRIRGIRGDKRGNIELRVLRVVLDWGRGLGLVRVGVWLGFGLVRVGVG